MRILISLFSIVSFSVFGSTDCTTKWDNYLANNDLQPQYKRLKYLCGEDFKIMLNKLVRANHKKTGYREARDYMFSELDNVNGEVCGVYTQECIYTDSIPNGTVMNCEHTWPKSKGARDGMGLYDLHHLFPTKSDINSTRSSYSFCEIATTEKGRHGSFLGKSTSNSRLRCFEPRDDHKGDVARAMFYFSIRYDMRIDFGEESFLRKWHSEDQVTKTERLRDINIQKFQGNQNPFIVHPEIVQFVQDF